MTFFFFLMAICAFALLAIARAEQKRADRAEAKLRLVNQLAREVGVEVAALKKVLVAGVKE